MKEQVRLFIAIEVSEQQKHELTELQHKLKGDLEGVRWVRLEGLHLTLKFFGEIEEEKIGLIVKAMDYSMASLTAFQIIYGGCGVFPSPQKARVIWTGLAEGASDVQKLAEKLENNLSGYNLAREKRAYHPHLTLGRLRYPLSENVINKIIEQERTFKTAAAGINGVILYKSQLFRQGAVYTPIHKATFKIET